MARTYRATINSHVISTLALVQWTLHYQTDVSTGGDEPNPNDVADGIWGVIGAAVTAVTTSRVHIDTVDVLEQVIPPALPSGGTHVVNVNGTLSPGSSEFPQAACLGINIHTDTRSRSSRGFCHMPPPFNATYSLGQTWGGLYLTNAQTLAALLDNSFDLGTLSITHVNPVVYSRKRHLGGETPYTFKVTSATANPKQRYVRSRDTSP
jgi:hypothetical protein